MAKIFPFKGILYNTKKIKNLSKVVSPPYDVIPKEMQEHLYQISNYNMIKLVLGKEFTQDTQYNNKYVRAAATFEGWLRHGVMRQDEKPAIYIYEQRFSYGGKSYVRIGFIAILRMEDVGRGKVHPHEETLARPKLDRIELMRATGANFDCVFTLYTDEKAKTLKVLKKFMRRKPIAQAKDETKVVHRLWRIDSKPAIHKLMSEMKDKAVFIADGHHRFEAAVRYKNEMKERNTRFTEDEAYNHVMMYFTPIEEKGLLIFPIHRLVKPLSYLNLDHFEDELANYFEIDKYPYTKRTEEKVKKKVLRDQLKREAQHAFIMVAAGQSQFYLLTLKDEGLVDVLLEEEKSAAYKHLDVTILHTIVMSKILGVSNDEHLTFTRNVDEVVAEVAKGGYQLGFILNPTKVSSILEIAGKGERLPQKSTYFYPKLISGLVMNKIVHGEKIK